MMNEPIPFFWRSGKILVVGGFLAVAACSTGEEQVAGIDGSGTPTPAAIIAQGPIQGFGSIIVNDVRYDIDAAQIRVNGANVTESELRIGQLVTVSGRVDAASTDGVADTVVFEANIQGPVERIDLDASTLDVLGQHVIVSPTTIVELEAGAELGSLAVGDAVQVSGFVNADGSIAATRIASLAAIDDLRVIGVITNLDLADLSFEIEDLLVDYSQALVIEGFASGAPANGDRVLVEGGAIDGEGALVARELTFVRATLSDSVGSEVEIEGLITRFQSITDFDVADIRIVTSPDTQYEGGSPADLQLDVNIEVEGTVDANGAIVAEEIEFEDDEDD